MEWLAYTDSMELKAGEELIVNQRIQDLKRPNGDETAFGVEVQDVVVYKETLSINEGERYFVVMLKEDVEREKRLGRKALYGEFVLANDQVKRG